jgi:hypothetical protein
MVIAAGLLLFTGVAAALVIKRGGRPGAEPGVTPPEPAT